MYTNSSQTLPMTNINLTVALALHLSSLSYMFDISEAEALLNEVDDAIDEGFRVSVSNNILLRKLVLKLAEEKPRRSQRRYI